MTKELEEVPVVIGCEPDEDIVPVTNEPLEAEAEDGEGEQAPCLEVTDADGVGKVKVLTPPLGCCTTRPPLASETTTLPGKVTGPAEM